MSANSWEEKLYLLLIKSVFNPIAAGTILTTTCWVSQHKWYFYGHATDICGVVLVAARPFHGTCDQVKEHNWTAASLLSTSSAGGWCASQSEITIHLALFYVHNFSFWFTTSLTSDFWLHLFCNFWFCYCYYLRVPSCICFSWKDQHIIFFSQLISVFTTTFLNVFIPQVAVDVWQQFLFDFHFLFSLFYVFMNTGNGSCGQTQQREGQERSWLYSSAAPKSWLCKFGSWWVDLFHVIRNGWCLSD